MTKLYTAQNISKNIHTYDMSIGRVVQYKKLFSLFVFPFLLSNVTFATSPDANIHLSNEGSNPELIIDHLLVTTHNDNVFQQDAEDCYLSNSICFNNTQESGLSVPESIYVNISNNPYLTAKMPNL